MSKLKATLLLTAALIGLSIQAPASANSVRTEVDGNTSTTVATTYSVKLKDIGRHYLVTNKTAKLHPFSSGKVSSHKSLTVPKNSVLTVQANKQDLKGKIVSIAGKKQKYLLAHPNNFIYDSVGVRNTPQTTQKLKAASKQWAKSLKKDQIKAIRYYTDKGYTKINTALRFPKQPASKKVTDSISKINTGIQTFKLAKPLTVYRGTSIIGLKKSLGNRSIKIGRSYADPAYSSCTLSQMIALGFSPQHVVLKVNLQAGHHGAYIDPISTNVGEKEYLLDSGAKLIVTGYQKAQSTVHTVVTVKKRGHAAKHHATNVKTNYTLVTLNLKQ